jgi:hypothetical protein
MRVGEHGHAQRLSFGWRLRIVRHTLAYSGIPGPQNTKVARPRRL